MKNALTIIPLRVVFQIIKYGKMGRQTTLKIGVHELKLRFWLIDINYQIINREPNILMWGVSESGERVLVVDRRFRPYFYVVPRKGVDIEMLKAKIMKLNNVRSPILSLEAVEKKYYGKPIKVLKLVTLMPDQVPAYREAIKNIPEVEDCLEADIRFYMRYLIDNDVQPSGWNEAEVVEHPSPLKASVDKQYILTGNIRRVESSILPQLKTVSFDIEVLNPLGNPRPEKDPIIIVSVVADGKSKVQFIADGNDDKPVIKSFVEFIRKLDPDIIAGYNSNGFDWPYLVSRGKHVGIKINVNRFGGEPHPSVYGHISIIGRANVDLYDFAEELTEVKVKSLENVADYLGVMEKDKRILIDWTEMAEYWNDPSKRPIFIKYAMQDAESTQGLAEKFIPFGIQLSSLTGLPLDQVVAAAVGFRVEWFLMREAYKQNELVPNRIERPYSTYKGAIVLEPKRGMHENIAVLDFTSMYPSIMIKYNISPDTYVGTDENIPEHMVWKAPEVGHKFLKSPPGFFTRVLKALIELRAKLKEDLKRLSPDSPEYRVIDERQRAVKVLTNAMYGYLGWTGARWYCKPAAEAITAWGRELITKAIDIARGLGLKVIYGDTDSLFVSYVPGKIDELIRLVREELGFEIKVDKVYKRVFFTEAKKRYCGLLIDGKVDIVGFEAVRGDWAEIAKEVQERVVNILLREGSVEKAVEYVKGVVDDVRNHKLPLSKLIIWKTLSKKLSEYEVEAPHVAAARKIVERGGKISAGEKIGYVIVKGSGKLSNRAYPYFMVKMEDIDSEYYIDRQIIPAVLRILGYFGVTEKTLRLGREPSKQRTLFDFFASGRKK